jgi:glycosyltransferase involved in cell wall biosynthesis
MPAREPLSVTVITYNEERNIERCLESVRWAEDLVVVDSGSTDRTRELARRHGARVFERPWAGYVEQ